MNNRQRDRRDLVEEVVKAIEHLLIHDVRVGDFDTGLQLYDLESEETGDDAGPHLLWQEKYDRLGTLEAYNEAITSYEEAAQDLQEARTALLAREVELAASAIVRCANLRDLIEDTTITATIESRIRGELRSLLAKSEALDTGH